MAKKAHVDAAASSSFKRATFLFLVSFLFCFFALLLKYLLPMREINK